MKKDYYFKAKDIGSSLAYIVSEIEGEKYICEYVEYYYPSFTRHNGFSIGSNVRLSIVKSGYEDLYFVRNKPCPWMLDKVAHPIKCIYDPHKCITDVEHYREFKPYENISGNFENEFKDRSDSSSQINPFPYLDDFIEKLASLQSSDQKLTQEEISHQAKLFVNEKKSGFQKVKK